MWFSVIEQSDWKTTVAICKARKEKQRTVQILLHEQMHVHLKLDGLFAKFVYLEKEVMRATYPFTLFPNNRYRLKRLLLL